MVPATLGLGHSGDYQTDRPCPQFVEGAGRLEGRGRQVAVEIFPEAIVEFRQQGACKKLGMGGGSGRRPVGSVGLPHITSKGLSPRGFLDKAHILRRTIGTSLVQSRCTSRASLVRVSLIFLFILSTFPEDWGPYGM